MSSKDNDSAGKPLTLRIGTSSLPGIYPRLDGTGLLRDGVYGIKSTFASSSEKERTHENIVKILNNALIWAYHNEVDIWVLPEMCLDEFGLDYLKRDLSTFDKNKPQIIIPGTTYIDEDNRLSNRAYIWERTSKKTWDFSKFYNKQIPFGMNIDTGSLSPDIKQISLEAQKSGANILEEAFVNHDRKLLTADINGYKFGVAICRDVLDVFDGYNPLFTYCHDNVDIMLVTSFNEGHTNLFTASAESMARWHNCTTIYVNNFTAVPSEQNNTVEVSFALTPDSTKVAGIQGLIYYRKQPTTSMSGEQSETIAITDCDYEQRVKSIYSSDVQARAIPSDGNVLYEFKNGKLVM